MSAQCHCCRQKLQDDKFYVRWFNFDKVCGPHRFHHDIFEASRLFVEYGELTFSLNGKTAQHCSIVGMNTGIVYRHNSDKLLPTWLKEPLLRAAIAAGAELPPIYKKDKKKVALNGDKA